MKWLTLLLLICAFSCLTYGVDSHSTVNKLAKEQVKARFLTNNVPLRYYSNILIRLLGDPCKEDSLIMKDLVDSLNVLIYKWDVFLIPKGTSNLDVVINESWRKDDENQIIEHGKNPWQIVKRTIVLNLPPNLDFTSRKKIIYYFVFRSLVMSKTDKKNTQFIPGSIFSEDDPLKITFHPVDFAIIKELYSHKYEDKPKIGSTARMAPDAKQRFMSYNLYNLVSLLIAFSFLIIISIRGKFKDHNYSFFPFLKQGLLVVAAGNIYIVLISLRSIRLIHAELNMFFVMPQIILSLFFTGFVAIGLIFLIERAILKRYSNLYLEIIVPFLSVTLVLPTLFLSFFLLVPDNETSIVVYFSALSGGGLFFLLTGFGRLIFIFTRKKSEGIIRKKDLELAKMNELHKQAELQSLRAKINPHFLYNTLNSIASLAGTDSKKTEQMALALSDFFKYAINREQKQLNTLAEELNAVSTYLEIEKVRFGDRLSFGIDCPEELRDIQIPQLLIQPLVENAIKHGLSHITENGLIQVSVSKAENQLTIRVYDNGPAFPDEPLTGFGIQNTQERITLLYGEKALLDWKNSPEKYIEVSLPFTKSNLPDTN